MVSFDISQNESGRAPALPPLPGFGRKRREAADWVTQTPVPTLIQGWKLGEDEKKAANLGDSGSREAKPDGNLFDEDTAGH